MAPVNYNEHVQFLPFNDADALEAALTEEVCAVIVEGIQGVGGIQVATENFLQRARAACDKTGTVLILDSVQCGYGRSGKFFSHQYADIHPDLITTAKGMGNGFPVGGVLISEVQGLRMVCWALLSAATTLPVRRQLPCWM